MEEHGHILDPEGEICTECGLFQEFFEVVDCPAVDDDADGEEEDNEDDTEVEETLS